MDMFCDISILGTKPSIHNFSLKEKCEFREKLITWFRENQRDLPWRKHLSNPDVDQRAYAGSLIIVLINQWWNLEFQNGGGGAVNSE